MVYHDFLDNELVTPYEKLMFIALKRYANNKNQCFPSLRKLAKLTGFSKSKIQDALKGLKDKHIITIEGRVRPDGGQSSNLYTLYDTAAMWQAESYEELKDIVKESEIDRSIRILTEAGYKVTHQEKEKGPACEPSKAHMQAPIKDLNMANNTTVLYESQATERYSLEQIHQLFEYNILIYDNPYQIRDIDSVMDILYDAMNTTKETIRISGEDKPAIVVIGKLMKLNKDMIMYAIKKFNEQTNRISNPSAYLLTILYRAPEQLNFDVMNQVSYDMKYNWDFGTEKDDDVNKTYS